MSARIKITKALTTAFMVVATVNAVVELFFSGKVYNLRVLAVPVFTGVLFITIDTVLKLFFPTKVKGYKPDPEGVYFIYLIWALLCAIFSFFSVNTHNELLILLSLYMLLLSGADTHSLFKKRKEPS